jgi:hypothetical protein
VTEGMKMLYEVDFSIKINGRFKSLHKELIFANSVTECRDKAKLIRDELLQNDKNQIHIFIEA